MAKHRGWPDESRRHRLAAAGIPTRGSIPVPTRMKKGAELPLMVFTPETLSQIRRYNEIVDGKEWIAEWDLVNGAILVNDVQFSDDVDSSYLKWDGPRDAEINVGYIHYHPANLVPLFTAQDFVLGCKLHKMRSEESKKQMNYTLMGLVVPYKTTHKIILIAIKPWEGREKQFEKLIVTDGKDPRTTREIRRIIAVMENKGELIRFRDTGLDGENMGKAGGLVI